ncbi:MAG TPA: response regulator [Candidatus Nitrosocosmicus sp.]
MQNKRNTAKWQRSRIILVDDEPDITFSFNIGLEDYGFAVDAFNDPLLALSSFKVGLYTMAILDIRMPKMNGFELGDKIRKLDDKIKISFMSAFDIPEENLKTTAPTLYEEKPLIIRKPISLDDFVSRIKEKLE